MALKSNPKQGLPASGGKYSYAQLQDLWVQNGGNPGAAAMAAAIAMAESGGDPRSTNHNTNGTTDRGLWQINSIWGAQSTYDVTANTKAAITISNNGSNWGPWSTFHNGAYKQFLGGENKSFSPVGGGGGGSGDSSSGGSGGSSPDLLTILGDIATFNLSDLAVNLAIAGVEMVKDIGLGFADWVVIPWWHWNQRAAQYYVSEELFSNTEWTALPWTAVFWGVGYWLFWTDPKAGDLKPAPVRNSRIGRHVRRAQAVPARRSLVKPKDVQSKTPKKPKPVVSYSRVVQTDTMSVTRSLPVKISGRHANRTQERNGQPEGLPGEAPIRNAGEVNLDAPKRDDAANGEPNAKHRAGNRSLSDSRGNLEGRSGPRRNGGGKP